MREWFTIAELRAAKLPTLTEEFMDVLDKEFPTLEPGLARLRHNPGFWTIGSSQKYSEREYNVLLFTQTEQRALQAMYFRQAEPVR